VGWEAAAGGKKQGDGKEKIGPRQVTPRNTPNSEQTVKLIRAD